MIIRRIIRRIRGRPPEPARKIKRELGFCGERVSIRMPCVIENAENVILEDDVSLASFIHIWGTGGVRIGARTMIGSHVAITSASHDPDSSEMWRTLKTEPIVIEEDVWIGAHAVILPGVTVGRNSVVAAGALVREDVAAFSIVAGVPAKLVRQKTQGELRT